MDQRQRSAVNSMRVHLTRALTVEEVFIAHFIEDGMANNLTEKITVKETSSGRAAAFLDEFLKHGKFDTFVRAMIETGQGHLADTLLKKYEMTQVASVSITSRVNLEDNCSGGRPLKLISVSKENQLILNDTVLEEVFAPIRNEFVHVIAASGIFRMGKSFLLNLFIRYLKSTDNNKDWRADDANPIDGFQTEGNWESVTSGMDIWSIPYFIMSKTGQRVAVLLLDTQGLDAPEMSHELSEKIYRLSSLLSDIQLYNVSKQFDRKSLEQLQYFAEMTKHTTLSKDLFNGANCEKQLVVVVRDAPDNLHKFGFVGGHSFWKEVVTPQLVKLYEGDTQRVKELEDTKCLLMTDPGKKMKKKNPFTGPPSDIDKDFLDHAEELIKHTVNPVAETPRKGCTVEYLAKMYLLTLEDGKIAPPQTIVKIQAEMLLKTAMEEAQHLYDEKMHNLKAGREVFHEEQFIEMFEEATKVALDHFDKAQKAFNNKEKRAELRKFLEKALQLVSDELKSHNHSAVIERNMELSAKLVKSYKDQLSAILNEDDVKFTKCSAEYAADCLKRFDEEAWNDKTSGKDMLEDSLKLEDEKLKMIKIGNKAIETVISSYNSEMSKAIELSQKDDFEAKHAQLISSARLELQGAFKEEALEQQMQKVMRYLNSQYNLFVKLRDQKLHKEAAENAKECEDRLEDILNEYQEQTRKSTEDYRQENILIATGTLIAASARVAAAVWSKTAAGAATGAATGETATGAAAGVAETGAAAGASAGVAAAAGADAVAFTVSFGGATLTATVEVPLLMFVGAAGVGLAGFGLGCLIAKASKESVQKKK